MEIQVVEGVVQILPNGIAFPAREYVQAIFFERKRAFAVVVTASAAANEVNAVEAARLLVDRPSGIGDRLVAKG